MRLLDFTIGMTGCLNALQHLHLPFVAPSLGGVESLVTLPAETSHLAIGLKGRKVCSLPKFHLNICYRYANAATTSSSSLTSMLQQQPLCRFE